MGERASFGQRQGSFLGTSEKFCPKHRGRCLFGYGFGTDRRMAPVPPNRSPEAGCLLSAKASWPQRDDRELGGPEDESTEFLRRRPGAGSSQTILQTDPHSRRLPPGPRGEQSLRQARRGGRRRLTGAAAVPAWSPSGGRGLRAPRPRPPPLGCLLRVPRSRGWGIRGGSVEGARWRRARRQLSDSDGDAGSAAPERRRAGGRDRERRRAVPAPSGLRPREAPPTSRPSPSALRATWSPRAPSPSCEEKTPTPRIGWGSAGRGSWTPRNWLTRDVGERAACACPPGHSSCGAGWEGCVGRESGF